TVGEKWIPKAPLNIARQNLAAIGLNDKIYVIGGSAQSSPSTICANTDVYDPATDSWTSKAPMATARMGLAIATLNGKIYAFGGGLQNGSLFNTVEEFDPSVGTNGQWATKAPMSVARRYASAAVCNGKIYVMGGIGDGNIASSVVEEFDPAAGPNGTWTTKTSMPLPMYNVGAIVFNGKILVTSEGANGYSIGQFDP